MEGFQTTENRNGSWCRTMGSLPTLEGLVIGPFLQPRGATGTPLIPSHFYQVEPQLSIHWAHMHSITVTAIQEPHGKRVSTNRNKLGGMQLHRGQQLSGPGFSRAR